MPLWNGVFTTQSASPPLGEDGAVVPEDDELPVPPLELEERLPLPPSEDELPELLILSPSSLSDEQEKVNAKASPRAAAKYAEYLFLIVLSPFPLLVYTHPNPWEHRAWLVHADSGAFSFSLSRSGLKLYNP
jgi:hypothetical protein